MYHIVFKTEKFYRYISICSVEMSLVAYRGGKSGLQTQACTQTCVLTYTQTHMHAHKQKYVKLSNVEQLYHFKKISVIAVYVL